MRDDHPCVLDQKILMANERAIDHLLRRLALGRNLGDPAGVARSFDKNEAVTGCWLENSCGDGSIADHCDSRPV